MTGVSSICQSLAQRNPRSFYVPAALGLGCIAYLNMHSTACHHDTVASQCVCPAC